MSNYDGKFVENAPNNPWNKCFDLIEAGSTVLDVGCSSGSFGDSLKKIKKCQVDGVEPDTGDAKKAEAKLDDVFLGTLEEYIGKTDKKYKYITFIDVIEHLNKPVDTLRALKVFMNEDSSIVFSIPNMAHISVRLMLLSGKFEYGNTGLLDNTHLHFYTDKEIERVFDEAGYKITEWDIVEVTYPKKVLKTELEKIGITNPTDEMIETLYSNNSSVFQYIGKAKLGKSKLKSIRPQYFPNAQGAITSWYEDRQCHFNEEIDRLQRENVSLTERLSSTKKSQLLKRIIKKIPKR